MASFALGLGFNNPRATAGQFVVDVPYIATNPATGLNRTLYKWDISLDPAAPAGWKAAIVAALVADAINEGFTDLVAARVFVPAFVGG
jgi:hypothetical protein